MPAAQPLEFTALPYQPDALLTRFAPLSTLPWAMLLHSGSAEHAHNRFDILVADPQVTLTTYGQRTEISRAGQEQVELSDIDPLPCCSMSLNAVG